MDEVLSYMDEDEGLPNNYGQRLGDALIRNTHVTELTLCLDLGHVDAPASVVSATNISSLLEYLGAHTSLRDVSLIGKEAANEIYVALCLHCLAPNPYITSLRVGEVPLFPSAELAFFLNMTRSLRKLEIHAIDNNDVVRGALETNQTLNELVLRINSFDESALGGDMLTMLTSHRSVCILGYEPQLPIEFITLLQNSRTLQELRLMTYFDGSGMVQLVNGLRECATSLTRLQFVSCKFTRDATAVLTAYFQYSGGAEQIFLSYELSFEDDETLEPFPTNTGEVMTTLLTGPCGVPALYLRGLSSSANSKFWNGLGAHASAIRLPRLKIDYSDWSHYAVTLMYKAIPQLLYMLDLTLAVPRRKSDHDKFQFAVLKNGSLYVVKKYEGSSLRFVKVACQRN